MNWSRRRFIGVGTAKANDPFVVPWEDERNRTTPGLMKHEGIDIEPRTAVFFHCTEKARSTFPGMPPH
jgi:hypothetical protein